MNHARTTGANELREGVVYRRVDQATLQLDIALPERADNKPSAARPAVVCIHGGGWRSGSRQAYRGLIQDLAQRGYVAATIDYRLAPHAHWPAQREDVQAAISWLIDHHDELGVDPERIGLLGASAGGHLALSVALRPRETDNQRRERLVVNFFGPTNLVDLASVQRAREAVEGLIGGTFASSRELLAEASPRTHVDRGDAPVLTFHGTADPIVPVDQAEQLHAALDESMVPNELWKMPGVGHGLDEDMTEENTRMDRFLHAYLRGSTLPLAASADFDAPDLRWQFTDPTAWEQQRRGNRTWLALTKKRSNYDPPFRSPLNIALLKERQAGTFVLDVDMRSTETPYGHQSLCLFFGYQDPAHFYYVHFGRQADAHANSVFLVNQAPRVSIASERTDGVAWHRGWHRARIRRELPSGVIEVFFDDMETPIMKATDTTFGKGRIGIGSFDDTGHFDAIRLWAAP